MKGYYRHTKIIATLGPATSSPEKIQQLIETGVDMVRLNMAHGSPEWVREIVGDIRRISEDVRRHVAVMMDVKGPEIRTGVVEEDIVLEAGDEFEFFTQSPTPGVRGVDVNYRGLPMDVHVGDTVLVDSGLIRMEIVHKDSSHVRCRVLTPGTMGSRRHINLPGVYVNLPSLTEKDERDLEAGIDCGIDFVALSFVRASEDVETLRSFLRKHKSRARIVSKIEDQMGMKNLEAIVSVSDGIMVARGDLGIEIDYHRLPIVQREIVEVCQAKGKPVIIATHLLESMIQSPMPTRAEITDVSNAVREMADAVMLSGETTTGRYPIESVEVLKSIIESVEPTVRRKINQDIVLSEPKTKMLRSAAYLAQELGKSGIIVFTRSGLLGYVLGALRARGVPVYAFTDIETVFWHLLLPWGVEPFLMGFSSDPEETILNAMSVLKRHGWCQPGSWLVVITNALAHDVIIDTIQVREVK
jgi:pyruvate kinase